MAKKAKLKETKDLGKDISLKAEKPIKISEEHLKEVQDLINKVNKSYIDVGNLEAQKHGLLHHITSLQEEIGAMRQVFETQYGTADIDIQTGTINYPKENGEVNKED